MNENELREIWNAGPYEATNPEQIIEWVRSERRATRRFAIRMGFFGFNLGLASVLGAAALIRGRTSLSETWPALVSLVALWATYIEFVRFRMRESRRQRRMAENVVTAVSWTLRQTIAAAREIKWLLAVNGLLVIPMTLVSVQSLLGSGKMTSQQALSYGLFCMIVLGGNLIVLSIHLLKTLFPRLRQLRACINTIDS